MWRGPSCQTGPAPYQEGWLQTQQNKTQISTLTVLAIQKSNKVLPVCVCVCVLLQHACNLSGLGILHDYSRTWGTVSLQRTLLWVPFPTKAIHFKPLKKSTASLQLANWLVPRKVGNSSFYHILGWLVAAIGGPVGVERVDLKKASRNAISS